MTLPALHVEDCGPFRVVRDDLLPGGTKRRILERVLADHPAREFVYGSPCYGFAQIALAHAAKAVGKKATVYVAGRKQMHPRTKAAQDAGAEILEVAKAGYLAVVQKRARDLAADRGACFLPLGLDSPVYLDAMAAIARDLPGPTPTEVWSVAGTGVLTRGMQQAWPLASFHAVRIGKAPNVGRARLYDAPEKFEDPAEFPPPFPSCEHYDAKAWRFMLTHANPGSLFWNVGADR